MPDTLTVFISWSGDISHAIANALRDWLPLLFQSKVAPWLSSEDIKAGARGYEVLSSQLQKAHVGIVCLTEENLNSPWIHWEAGALSKAIEESYVCTYLVGVKFSDVQPPLSLFQHSLCDYDGTRRMVDTINAALGEMKMSPEMLTKSFDVWWKELAPKLKATLAEAPASKAVQRSVSDILDELVSLTRETTTHVQRLSTQAAQIEQRLATMAHRLEISGQTSPRPYWYPVSPRVGSMPDSLAPGRSVVVQPVDPSKAGSPLSSDEWKRALLQQCEQSEALAAGTSLAASSISFDSDSSLLTIRVPKHVADPLLHDRYLEMLIAEVVNRPITVTLRVVD